MMQIFNMNQAKEWDNLVQSFTNYDVYYLSGYVKAFQIHGDGEPQLFYYDEKGLRGIYVYMKRKTAIEGVLTLLHLMVMVVFCLKVTPRRRM